MAKSRRTDYAGGIIGMSAEAYYRKLQNERYDRLMKEDIARQERVRDAEINLMNAQAEYFRELTKQLQNKK